MKVKLLFLHAAALVAAMMCALGASAAEAYANYTPSNTTLTFYYDNQRSSRTGTTYDLNEGNNWPGWMSDGTAASVTRVVFNSSFAGARPSSAQAWFANMTNLQSVLGIQYLNTSEVTNMFYMFAYCGLPSLNLSYLNTSNVTSMEGMFLNSSFTSLDVSSFNTSNVVDMNEMFAYCYNLTSLDLSTFNTSNVTNMEGMFNESISLESINMSNWNTSNVTDMSYMFNECNALSSIDVSHFNTSKVTDMQSMFNYCTSLTSLDLRHFNTSNVTNMEGMFNNCQALESLNVSNWNTSNVTNMGNMFANCSRLTSLDLGGFNTSKVTLMWYMFSGCSQLVTIYAGSGWSTAAVTDFYSDKMFLNCTKIRGGQGTTYDATHVNRLYARIDGGTSNPGYFTEKGPEAYADVTINATNFPDANFRNYLLSEYPSGTITTAQLNARTELVVESKYIYDAKGVEYFTQLTKLDFYNNKLTSIDVSALTKLTYLNLGKNKLTSINVDNNTALEQLYLQSNQLTSVTVEFLSDLRTLWVSQNPNLTNLECASNALTNLDVYNCTAMTNLNCNSNPNLSFIGNLGSCTAITYLDCEDCKIGDLSAVISMPNLESLYARNNKLETLDVSGLNKLKNLRVSGNQIASMNVSNCPNLKTMSIYYNRLTGNAMGNLIAGLPTCSSGDAGMAYVFVDPNPNTGATDGNVITDALINQASAKHWDLYHYNWSNSSWVPYTGSSTMRGDVNGDGSVNISDVTALIDYLLSGNASGINLSGADCNQDSSVNISDVTSLINYLLRGTW